MTTSPQNANADMRQQLREFVEQLAHVLPEQAPLKDFVHHNTLHAYQHLPFPEALKAARQSNGIYAYLPEEEFRRLYAQGRITRNELLRVLREDEDLKADEAIFSCNGETITRADVMLHALRHPLKPVTGSQLTWQIEEQRALTRFQPDVGKAAREKMLQNCGREGLSEAELIGALWSSCLEALGLQHFIMHPEELVDLDPDDAEKMLSDSLHETVEVGAPHVTGRLVLKESEYLLRQTLERVGPELTMRGLLKLLSGQDLLDDIRPLLVRHLSAYLDQGAAAWHHPDRNKGFYALWRQCAAHDMTWRLEEMLDLSDELKELPEDALETVINELSLMGIPQNRRLPYLERLVLELPGWSGMFLWRARHPAYESLVPEKVDMMDYLAVRLVLERLYARRLCRDLWAIQPRLELLRWYFRRHRYQFLVRYLLHTTRLPEYLTSRARGLLKQFNRETDNEEQWQLPAQMIWTWRQSPAADRPLGYSVFRGAWRLFRLAQHMSLPPQALQNRTRPQIDALFQCLDDLNDETRGFIWLRAYETHYRDRLFNALVNNRGRGPWARRETRPRAQIVFCMDEREESIRRHLEEINPAIETMGAAGFFGVAMNWRGLDDKKNTALCPVVVTPSHDIHETPAPGQEAQKHLHDKRRRLRLRLSELFFQETRRGLLSSLLLLSAGAFIALLMLLGKLLVPFGSGRFLEKQRRAFDLEVESRVALQAADDGAATPSNPRQGFTDTEQVERVWNFLRTIGLRRGFGSFVVMMGHGSISQNNPHLSAYDCGACSGRHGGPNARVFAAMANRPEIRALLFERGLRIPEDTWFLGAEHNTCDETIHWYDTDLVPETLRENFAALRDELKQAATMSAHERARRFASAPLTLSPLQALRHVIGRSTDFSQVRPELGHATNAAAFIGRRSLSRGAFFDRRVFLISYDPTQDPEGSVLEAILLAAGPVGAGINLEYYFSTVNNDQYGCGSKVTHNLTGLFGVMEGTTSDLRTGLPRQMIEIHEAMRLQVVVEATQRVLAEIYQRQPPLQELIGNGWLLLSAIDPDSGTISVFNPKRGFESWEGEVTPLPEVTCSRDWYTGRREPLEPVLIKQVEGIDA